MRLAISPPHFHLYWLILCSAKIQWNTSRKIWLRECQKMTDRPFRRLSAKLDDSRIIQSMCFLQWALFEWPRTVLAFVMVSSSLEVELQEVSPSLGSSFLHIHQIQPSTCNQAVHHHYHALADTIIASLCRWPRIPLNLHDCFIWFLRRPLLFLNF